MIPIKKKGKRTWKYSWHVGKAIRGEILPLFPGRVDSVEWSIGMRIPNNAQVCTIVVDGKQEGFMVFRITARAVHLNNYVQLLISNRIDY